MLFEANEAFLSKLEGKSVVDGLDRPIQEHLHCRSEGRAALFDLSFLIQISWRGKDSIEFLERILAGDIASLKHGACILSVMTNETGGVVDDAIITNVGDHFVMTTHDRYEEHFNKQLEIFGGEVEMEYFHHSILALQGPGSPSAMEKLLPPDFDLERMAFMSSKETRLLGNAEVCRIARCGFTGEDGFELHIPTIKSAVLIASKLLEDPSVMPGSLTALNTLRLEAGLCAKGKELGESVSPVEASLGWTISRRRRQEGRFLGADRILTEDGRLQKATRKLVGIVCPTEVPEESTEILDATGRVIVGQVTSAAFSPCLNTPIAMAYVETAFAKTGGDVLFKTFLADGIGYKVHKAQVMKPAFVKTRFYRMPDKSQHHKDAERSLTTIRDPATGELFEIPRLKDQNEECKMHQAQVATTPPEVNEDRPLVEVRDPATGEVFESPRHVATTTMYEAQVVEEAPFLDASCESPGIITHTNKTFMDQESVKSPFVKAPFEIVGGTVTPIMLARHARVQ